MKPRSILLLLACLPAVCASSASGAHYAGQLVEYEPAAEYSIQQVTQTLAAAYTVTGEDIGPLMRSATAVKAYAIKYYTPYVDGRLVIASGLVSMPEPLAASYPVVAYMHGTALKNDQVPSYPDRCDEALLINTLFASHGYVAVMPDYIGQGRGTNDSIRHPYLYAATTATTVTDMLKAVNELSALLPVQLNNKLFICGLSQGGHATMAAQRYIEQAPAAQPFRLVASAPCAGPYYLPILWDFWLANNPYKAPPLIAHLYLSYKRIYGISETLGSVFTPPYDGRIESIDDGTHTDVEMCSMLPATIQTLMQAGFINVVNARTHPFYSALAANLTCDFAPAIPTRLYHAVNDELVPYSISTYALERMKALGARDLEIVPLAAQWNHVTGLFPFTLAAKRWFDALGRCVPNDYDGDARADPALYSESSGLWAAALSSSQYQVLLSSTALGAGAAPAPGDYNGDELADMAVYNNLNGEWKVLLTSTGEVETVQFGGPDFAAAQCDIDGDEKTDPVVYREADGFWLASASSMGYASWSAQLGAIGFQAVPADYDGDAKADPAVYQESSGVWAFLLSGADYALVASAQSFGGPGFMAVPADYDGDSLADPALYSPATAFWQILLSGSFATRGVYTYQAVNAGNVNGIPVPADYDGDHKADPAVYHRDNGLWEIFLSGSGYQSAEGFFGGPDYFPVME